MRNPVRPLLSGAVAAVAGAAGTALGAAFAVTATIRRSKPLHPVGTVGSGVLTVEPAASSSGTPLLDRPGEHECLVRASYAVGTGPEGPDIEGFALRVRHGDGTGGLTDILFASTGVGPVTRYLLTVRSPGHHAPQTTLLPVRADGHPLQLRLDPLDQASQPWPTRYVLSWAWGTESWHRCGALDVSWHGGGDPPARFDPVANPVPGTRQYPVVAALREPSYLFSRLSRPSAGRLPAEGSQGGR